MGLHKKVYLRYCIAVTKVNTHKKCKLYKQVRVISYKHIFFSFGRQDIRRSRKGEFFASSICLLIIIFIINFLSTRIVQKYSYQTVSAALSLMPIMNSVNVLCTGLRIAGSKFLSSSTTV